MSTAAEKIGSDCLFYVQQRNSESTYVVKCNAAPSLGKIVGSLVYLQISVLSC